MPLLFEFHTVPYPVVVEGAEQQRNKFHSTPRILSMAERGGAGRGEWWVD